MRTQGEGADFVGVLDDGLLGGLTLREREAVVALVTAEPAVRARVAEMVLLLTAV